VSQPRSAKKRATDSLVNVTVNSDGSDPSPVDPWLNITVGNGGGPGGVYRTTSSSTGTPPSTKGVGARTTERVAKRRQAVPLQAVAAMQLPCTLRESSVRAPSFSTTCIAVVPTVTATLPLGWLESVVPPAVTDGFAALAVVQFTVAWQPDCPSAITQFASVNVPVDAGGPPPPPPPPPPPQAAKKAARAGRPRRSRVVGDRNDVTGSA